MPLPGSFAYTTAALGALLFGRRIWSVTGSLDNERIEARLSLLGVGNGTYTGGGFRMHPGARTDDGWLDACLCTAGGRFSLLRLLPRARRGTHGSHPAMRTLRLRRGLLRADPPMPVHADGELISEGAGEVEFGVLPAAVRVRLPR